jgi:methionine-rich copper-binding protein CopC
VIPARPLTRPLRALMAVLALLIGVLLGTATAAQAHTALASSSPADGSTVTDPLPAVDLTFTGRVLLREVTVTDPAGAPATAGPATAAGAVITQPIRLTAAGAYTVGYAVTSSDGHPLEGVLTFTYSPPTPPTPSSEAATSVPAPSATVEARAAAPDSAAQESTGLPGWVLWAGAAVVLAIAVVLILRRRRSRP